MGHKKRMKLKRGTLGKQIMLRIYESST